MITAVFQRLGPFDIESEIGRGGMATVFLARDTRNGARVALKLVPIGTDREAVEVLEAERWGAVLHERFSKICRAVPAVYEYKNEGQYFYIAMEYVDGRNLSEVLARGALQPDRAVRIAVDLCRVLEAAHAFEAVIDQRQFRALIHGDLKPRNIRLTANDGLKVLDFGIAKALSLSRRVTRNDFGSMAYLSPERLETGEVDAQSDCWAVGVLLYEMLSGEQPFRADDTRQLEKRITLRQPPESLTARCPVALQAIISKLFAPHLSDRYDGAGAIRHDLERFAHGQLTEAERQGWPNRAVDQDATRRTRTDGDEPATRRTHRGLGPPAAPPRIPQIATSRTPRTRPKLARLSPPRFLKRIFLLLAFFIVANEACVGARAGRLAPVVAERELNALDDVWEQYDELADRSVLGIGVARLERSLRRQTIALTDRVIARYRTGSAVVWEPEWTLARRALARAAALPEADRRLHASLRYCEGHLFRINGEARKGRREAEEAQRHFADAVAAFREAAELRPDWPDPFLGLARTFIYGLEDVDRGADALKQAQQRGYTPGERETTQLADGYRRRAETLARTAAGLRELPQEQEYLSRAAEAFRLALTLYGSLEGSDASASIRRTLSGLRRVTARIEELSSSAAPVGVPVPEGMSSEIR